MQFGVGEKAIAESKGELDKYSAFIDLHIEQGPFLERRGIEIGVPSGIVGITRLVVSVKGVANHAGTTPMDERKDAMRVAAELIHNWFGWMDWQKELVCNIGVLELSSGHVSVVPEEARFVLELRSIDDMAVERACSEFSAMAEISAPCSVSIEKLGTKLVKTIKESAANAGYSVAVMPSSASHDSSPLAHVIPTGMIFVPSHNGISHLKGEFTSNSDLIRSAKVLKETLLRIGDSF